MAGYQAAYRRDRKKVVAITEDIKRLEEQLNDLKKRLTEEKFAEAQSKQAYSNAKAVAQKFELALRQQLAPPATPSSSTTPTQTPTVPIPSPIPLPLPLPLPLPPMSQPS